MVFSSREDDRTVDMRCAYWGGSERDAVKAQMPREAPDHIDNEPMTRAQWAVVLGSFASAIVLVNHILPIPDVNDFTGLAQICILMERGGLLHAINMNWGFAHPLLSYVLTLLTHDLLLSQRILSGVACLAAILCIEHLMRRKLPVHASRTRMAFLLALICSPWMLESMVSVHMDIFPIVLTMTAIALIPDERPRALFVGGFVVAAGYWFRFHFLIYTVLFVFLVLNYHWRRRGVRKALFAASGVISGLAIPSILAITAGKQVGTNIKMQVAYKTRGFSWNVDYLLALEKRSLGDVLRHVDVAHILANAGIAIVDNGTLLLLLCLFVGLCAMQVRNVGSATASSGKKFYRSILPLDPNLALVAFVLTPFLLLTPIRGITLRMQAGVFIIGFAVLAHLFTIHAPRYLAGMVVAILIISISGTPFLMADYHERTATWQDIDRQVAATIPASVRHDSPYTVFNLITDYSNKENRYWMWNPVLTGGWGVLSSSFRDEFGYIDCSKLESEDFYKKFKYIILPKKPHYSFEKYDRKIMNLANKVVRLKSITILEMSPPSNTT